MAHGGSGDVKPEWFEGIFEKALEKYEGVRADMAREGGKQEALLERIRVSCLVLPPEYSGDQLTKTGTKRDVPL